jgi:1-acyl-sn-glycerol-3-phosphate acyltransferase
VTTPLIPSLDPPSERRRRILGSIARELVAFCALTLLSPLVLLAAGAVDAGLWLLRRKPWMTIRLVALVWWFLAGELKGLASLLVVWLLAGGPLARDTPARRRRVYKLQVAWATGHLAGVRRLFRLRVEVIGADRVGEGPLIVLYRHASIVDNALPAALISQPHGIDLNYVLKDGLQAFPTLDIGARWVPTCFVQRGSDDPAREIARVRMLATDLGEREGVLIYPEGTRCAPAKLAAIKARTDLDPLLAERIDGFRHLLPPRLGGPLAVMEEAPDAAVLVVGHVGLDGFHGLRSIWSGRLLGATVRVQIWRHEARELPAGRDARAAWLYDRWQELDDWVGAAHAETEREPLVAVTA